MRSRITYNAITPRPLDAHPPKIGISAQADRLAAIEFLPRESINKSSDNYSPEEVVKQPGTDFNNAQFHFDVPLMAQGTIFQQCVWQLLQATQAGRTFRYGEFAARFGGSVRAVGNAWRSITVPIVFLLTGLWGNLGVQAMAAKPWLSGYG
jgi:hypothetical protein